VIKPLTAEVPVG